MKQYIGTKLLQAQPMTRGAYNVHRGWTIPVNEDPDEAGYIVQYADGYISWSPSPQFEKSYRTTDRMTFGDAVMMLKAGQRVARAGWNGKGMWLAHIPYWRAPLIKADDGVLVQFTTLPFIAMRTVTGELVPWLASQTDVLAEDWMVVR